MNIKLEINGIGFLLGDSVNEPKLGLAKCAKAGFLDRFQIKAPRNDVVYWAKNCKVTCFSGGRNQPGARRDVRDFSVSLLHRWSVTKREVPSVDEFHNVDWQRGSVSPALSEVFWASKRRSRVLVGRGYSYPLCI